MIGRLMQGELAEKKSQSGKKIHRIMMDINMPLGRRS